MGGRLSLVHAMLGLQALFFVALIVVFTQMEQSRTSELHDLQLQLRRLRSENLQLAASGAEERQMPPAPGLAEPKPKERRRGTRRAEPKPKEPPPAPPTLASSRAAPARLDGGGGLYLLYTLYSRTTRVR